MRANLAFRTSGDRFRANLRVEHFDWDTDNNAVKNRADLVTSDPFMIEEDARSFLNQQGHRTSLEMRFALTDGVDLRMLSSWQHGNTEDQTDGDRTATARPQPPATNVGRVAYARTVFETWLHEVNLLSTGEGPVQWVVGAFYMDEDVPVTLLRDNRNTTRLRAARTPRSSRRRTTNRNRCSARSTRSSASGSNCSAACAIPRTRRSTTASRCRARRCPGH